MPTEYITLGSVVGTIIVSTAGLTWWLSVQFRDTRAIVYKLVKEHETEDNRRHEENLSKFTKLTLQIAKLRWHMKIPDTSTGTDENGGG